MNIFWHELRMYRRSMLTWIAALAASIIVFLSIFPAFYREVSVVTQVLGAFPQAFRDAFGVSIDLVASLIGFYTFLIAYIALMGAIQAMNIGTSLLAKESSGKTVDFILTKPATRSHIIAYKLLAGLVILVITNLVYLAVASATAYMVTPVPFDYRLFLLLSLTVFFIQLIFFAFGFLISTLRRKIKSVLPITLGTVFGFFIVSLFSSAINDDKLRYLTPFRYFDPAYIVDNAGYEPVYLLLGLGLILVSVVAGFVIYNRRDIYAG